MPLSPVTMVTFRCAEKSLLAYYEGLQTSKVNLNFKAHLKTSHADQSGEQLRETRGGKNHNNTHNKYTRTINVDIA